MFEFDDIDFINQGWDADFNNYYNTPESTKILGNFKVDNSFYLDMPITTGRWRLHIAKPSGNLTGFTSTYKDVIPVLDPVKGYIEKEYEIQAMEYDVSKDMLYVDIELFDNSLSAGVVYGAVAVVLLIVGAMSANSVLVKVEALIKTTGGAIKSSTIPILAISSIFILPLLIPILAKGK